MADETRRVIDQTTDSSLSAGDYVIVDSQSEGTRKFDLGTELTDIKQDLDELKNDAGVTAELKSALLDIAENIAYINENGQTLYDNLYNALYPNAQSISCVYTQAGTVYSTDSLNNLKSDLVVTAYYSDSTSRVLRDSDYTLTGTLEVGTSTITVHYGDLTTTFNTTVTSRTLSSISATYTQSGTVYDYDDLDSLKTDLVVIATYNDSSTETVSSSDYELTGSLSSASSIITVTYEGKTDTFTVNVTVTILFEVKNRSYDRENDCDDTGVQLMATDRDFTILMDGYQENAIPTGTAVRLMWCATQATNWKGIFWGAGSASSNTYYAIQWMSGDTGDVGFLRTQSNTSFKMVYRHTAGSNKAEIAIKVNNGSVTTKTLTSTYASNDSNLFIGGTGTITSNWIGTMNLCRVHNIVLSDDYVNAFLGS